jgi:ABC transporter
MSSSPLVHMRGITKRFPRVLANDRPISGPMLGRSMPSWRGNNSVSKSSSCYMGALASSFWMNRPRSSRRRRSATICKAYEPWAQLGTPLSSSFITHKLDEVLAIADRITVLSQGRVVANPASEEVRRLDLARCMVGRDLLPPPKRVSTAVGEVVLSVAALSARSDKGWLAVKNASLEVRRREILGIAGVAGNGQRELAEVVAGLRRAAGGSVSIQGADLTNAPRREIMRRGVSYIPEDRQGMRLVAGASIEE